jgi:hypothetical protein
LPRFAFDRLDHHRIEIAPFMNRLSVFCQRDGESDRQYDGAIAALANFFPGNETCERKTNETSSQWLFIYRRLGAHGLLCDQPDVLTEIELFDPLLGKADDLLIEEP